MSGADRPNVVWIAMEDTTPRLGCYGDDLARTPNVDGLAADGRRYPNAFSTAPVCAPSRAAVMTGCHQNAIGAHHMRTTHTNDDAPELPTPYEAVPPHYVTAVPEFFRGAGYYCTLDEKADYQFGTPFTMWDHHGDGAGWWDDARDPDQPFFAMFTNGVTHESGQWDPTEPGTDDQFGGAVADPDTDPDAVDVPPSLPDTEETRTAIARQYDNVARSDQWVGDLLDRLDADGLAADTIVVLWSDHGEGLPRSKRWPYDGGIHVPLIVRWPGEVDGGGVDGRLVSMMDLGPTTMAACGLDVPQYVGGRRFLGPDADEREYVFATRDRYDESYDMVRAVRDHRFKYVRHYRPGTPYRQWIPFRNRHPVMRQILERAAADELEGPEQWFDARRPAEELYDLRADPHEVDNLAGDSEYSDTLQRFRDALDEWRDRVDDAGDTAEAEMVHDRYRGEEQPETAAPRFVVNAPDHDEREARTDGLSLEAPATLSLYCATQGASVAYAFSEDPVDDDGSDPQWTLYTGPVELPEGETTVRAKAVRYGFEESEAQVGAFTVSE
ncbi:sulfatase-like hydrolase/transferase [Halosimplex amylolyticum]|uniref:sulfatase-like hydrolase/transferase n=1 Tax=Halosimplex amylolyticum TaxID=3396616 RepID=UPI003F54563E